MISDKTRRELLILRHGKSDWDAGTDDFHRPLKKRGRRGAKKIGLFIKSEGFTPDAVWTSPARRALDTARLCMKAMDSRLDLRIDRDFYHAEAEEMLSVLRTCPENTKRLLLVGHNPGLEDLVRLLSRESIPEPEDGKLLPTATLARLLLPGDWGELSPSTLELSSITRARLL